MLVLSHPNDEVVDQYVFNRLSDEQTAFFEEHLLACSSCQTRLTDIDDLIAALRAEARWSGGLSAPTDLQSHLDNVVGSVRHSAETRSWEA